MPLSNAVVRENADALNTLFNAQQALLILALVNAAVDQSQTQLTALDARVDALEAV